MPATPRAIPQGTLDLLILRTLEEGPSHGYAVARRIEQTTDDALRIEEGTLYPALHRMQRHGWITASWARSELGKDVKTYTLTAAGRRELRRRTDDWRHLTSAVSKVLRMT
jgi:transcriptional regulator